MGLGLTGKLGRAWGGCLLPELSGCGLVRLDLSIGGVQGPILYSFLFLNIGPRYGGDDISTDKV